MGIQVVYELRFIIVSHEFQWGYFRNGDAYDSLNSGDDLNYHEPFGQRVCWSRKGVVLLSSTVRANFVFFSQQFHNSL